MISVVPAASVKRPTLPDRDSLRVSAEGDGNECAAEERKTSEENHWRYVGA